MNIRRRFEGTIAGVTIRAIVAALAVGLCLVWVSSSAGHPGYPVGVVVAACVLAGAGVGCRGYATIRTERRMGEAEAGGSSVSRKDVLAQDMRWVWLAGACWVALVVLIVLSPYLG